MMGCSRVAIISMGRSSPHSPVAPSLSPGEADSNWKASEIPGAIQLLGLGHLYVLSLSSQVFLVKYKQYKWSTGKKSTRATQIFDPVMELNHP